MPKDFRYEDSNIFVCLRVMLYISYYSLMIMIMFDLETISVKRMIILLSNKYFIFKVLNAISF